MRLCFFGAYDLEYPRNTVVKRGLRLNGVEVSECWLPGAQRLLLPELGLPSEKVEVLPVGFDDDLFRPSAAAEKENLFTVLFFGALFGDYWREKILLVLV